MKSFEIYFDDLTPEAQESICLLFETTRYDENWESAPLAVIDREDEDCWIGRG